MEKKPPKHLNFIKFIKTLIPDSFYSYAKIVKEQLSDFILNSTRRYKNQR